MSYHLNKNVDKPDSTWKCKEATKWFNKGNYNRAFLMCVRLSWMVWSVLICPILFPNGVNLFSTVRWLQVIQVIWKNVLNFFKFAVKIAVKLSKMKKILKVLAMSTAKKPFKCVSGHKENLHFKVIIFCNLWVVIVV